MSINNNENEQTCQSPAIWFGMLIHVISLTIPWPLCVGTARVTVPHVTKKTFILLCDIGQDTETDGMTIIKSYSRQAVNNLCETMTLNKFASFPRVWKIMEDLENEKSIFQTWKNR